MLAIVAILLTVKRRAMIALGLSGCVYAMVYLRINGNVRTIFRLFFIFIIISGVVSYTVWNEWGNVVTRFEDTTGSGRTEVYSMTLHHWFEADDPDNLIFGFLSVFACASIYE